jgi:hypothetical protein
MEEMNRVTWIEKLRQRWNVPSAFQVVIILIVFACTGTTVVLIKRPLFSIFFADGVVPVFATVIYYLLILPVYNLLLLFYGFVFGQFQFFWSFEKRFFNRVLTIFKK